MTIKYFKEGTVLRHLKHKEVEAKVVQTLLHNYTPMGVHLEVLRGSEENDFFKLGTTLFYSYNTETNIYGPDARMFWEEKEWT